MLNDVISFRFDRELDAETLDDVISYVQRKCRASGYEPPVITFGDPPAAALIPDVLTIQSMIAAKEACHDAVS